jgi:micrococcal nuclease
MVLLVCWVLGLASSCASDEQQGSGAASEESPPAVAADTTQEEARLTTREPEETTAEPTGAPERTTPATSSSDLAGLLAEEGDGGGDGPSDGYVAVTDGAGALSVEVPLGWDHATGEESETGGRNWSDFAGEVHKASITAAPNLDAWHTAGGVPGIYAVASKGLARGYTDEQLVASGPFDLSSACEPGARSDFERGPYAGRMQAWRNCEVGAAATFVTLSAAPEGRECVVLMQLAMYGEADVEVGQHILDAFEVECAAAATYPLAAADEQQYAPEQQHHAPEQYAPEQHAGASESTPASDGPDRDCADFASRDEAQAALQADSSDPYDLDADDDGEACEDSFPEEATQDEYEYQYEDPAPSTDSSPDPARVPSRGDVDCSDFSSSAEAKPYLLPGDPHRLDADGDGQACDSLP